MPLITVPKFLSAMRGVRAGGLLTHHSKDSKAALATPQQRFETRDQIPDEEHYFGYDSESPLKDDDEEFWAATDEAMLFDDHEPKSSSQAKLIALPKRLLRGLQNNLTLAKRRESRRSSISSASTSSKGSSTRHSTPRRQTKPNKKAEKQRDPLAHQTEISLRISEFILESCSGSQEPHLLFVGEKEPPISFQDYVVRLVELTNKWVEERDGPSSFGIRCALVAIDFMERLNVQLHSRSVHRYFMAAVLVAIKLLYDYYISNAFWAEVAGCTRKQVNLMESQFCRQLSWNFGADSERFTELCQVFGVSTK